MTDFSRDRRDIGDEDRLPWLDPVEEDVEETGIGGAKLIGALVAGLLILGLLIGGFFWMRGRRDMAASGDGSVIKAPDSYYKERPADPGGMDVGSGDEIVYSASKGNEVDSTIDVSGAAEAPVNVDRPKPAAPVPAPATAAPAKAPVTDAAVSPKVAPPVAKPAPPKPKPVTVAPEPAPAASGGSTVQLGAFSSEAKANAAWKTLSGRFSFLSGLTQSVVPVASGDKTLYRLRASGADAGSLCAKLRTAGESCTVIG
ncbi:MAG: Sporulation related protein [Rhizorhabdus sp.]|nr:Sporulation related protein [Rhizorhabdus sp.]